MAIVTNIQQILKVQLISRLRILNALIEAGDGSGYGTSTYFLMMQLYKAERTEIREQLSIIDKDKELKL